MGEYSMSIKELRTSAKMTQQEFAYYFNIPMRTIQNWEGGKRNCPKYLAELIEYKLRKEVEHMKDFTGARWGCLTEKEREYLLGETNPIDGRTGNSPKESMECIIDLANGYSVPGYCKISADEDEIIIEDDAVIYNPTS